MTVIFAPIIFVVTLFHHKYRGRVFKRLGFKLNEKIKKLPRKKQKIWIHALSVGEASSVRTFVQEMRREFPDALILFSSTTRSGEQHAGNVLADYVDCFIPFPLDNYWVSRYFIKLIHPNLFVLVETDFWPNFISLLKSENIPAILINGRISEGASANYCRFKFFLSDYGCPAGRRCQNAEVVRGQP